MQVPDGPYGMAADASHLYWATSATGTMHEAGLNRTGPRAIVSGQNGPAAGAAGP